jgi:hypothetical protein
MSKNSDLNDSTPPNESGALPGDEDGPLVNADRHSIDSATAHVDTRIPGSAVTPSLSDDQPPTPDTPLTFSQRATPSPPGSPQPTVSNSRSASTPPTGNERAAVTTHLTSPVVAGTIPLDNADQGIPVAPAPLALPFDPSAYPPPAAVHGKRAMKSRQAHQFENQKSQKTAARESAPPLQLKSAPNPYQVSIFMLESDYTS